MASFFINVYIASVGNLPHVNLPTYPIPIIF